MLMTQNTKVFNTFSVFEWPLLLLLLLSAAQIELAILRFPYDSWGTPFQQLKQVVEEPSPQLPADQFSPDFVDFTSQWCVFYFPVVLFQFCSSRCVLQLIIFLKYLYLYWFSIDVTLMLLLFILLTTMIVSWKSDISSALVLNEEDFPWLISKKRVVFPEYPSTCSPPTRPCWYRRHIRETESGGADPTGRSGRGWSLKCVCTWTTHCMYLEKYILQKQKYQKGVKYTSRLW